MNDYHILLKFVKSEDTDIGDRTYNVTDVPIP